MIAPYDLLGTNTVDGLGQRLRQKRDAYRQTQAQMSKALGLSRSYYSLLEANIQLPSFWVFACLCDQLRLHGQWLLCGEGKERYQGKARQLPHNEDRLFSFAASRLAKARKKQGITQPGLDRILNFPRHKTAFIENNSQSVTLRDMTLIGRYLDKPIDYFIWLPRAAKRSAKKGS